MLHIAVLQPEVIAYELLNVIAEWEVFSYDV